MPSEERDEYHWRETYFILYDSRSRPTLTQIERALGELSDRYQLGRLMADDEGRFESLTLNSPDDNAALEISHEEGEAVVEQTTELAKQLKNEAEPDQLAALLKADARLDVMHFEQVTPGEEDEEEMLDPSCLLLVVDALVKLTEGIPIDPASGAILP